MSVQDVEMDTVDEVVDAQKKASEADALVLAGTHFHLHFL